MPKSEPERPLTQLIKLSEEERQRLEELAKQTGMTYSDILRQPLKENPKSNGKDQS